MPQHGDSQVPREARTEHRDNHKDMKLEFHGKHGKYAHAWVSVSGGHQSPRIGKAKTDGPAG